MTRGGDRRAEPPVRVLGIDPGTAVTGWGVIERRDGCVAHLAHGAVTTHARMSARHEARDDPRGAHRALPTLASRRARARAELRRPQRAERLSSRRGPRRRAAGGGIGGTRHRRVSAGDGQARGHRHGPRREGAGAARDRARAAAWSSGSSPDAADALAIALCHLQFGRALDGRACPRGGGGAAMIARLRGRLLEKAPEQIVVDAGGVGYQLFVSLNSFYRLPNPGVEVDLYVHTHVREDALQLYGFLDAAERALFLLLLQVSTIGPRVASACCRAWTRADLEDAIADGDARRLVAVPGIGKKKADLMVLQLREKVRVLQQTRAPPRRDRAPHPAATPPKRCPRSSTWDTSSTRRSAPSPAPSKPGRARSPTSSGKRCGGWPHERTRRRSADRATRKSASTSRCVRPGSRSTSARRRSRTTSGSRSRRRAPAATCSITCCSPARPGSARRSLAYIIAKEMGVDDPLHVGSGARASRRRRGDPHQSRARRRALHRRDPPPEPRRRGGALSRDGGLPARHHRRPGAVGADPQARAQAVHAGRRDDAHGLADLAAPRSLRGALPPRLLRRARARR